MNDLTQAQHWLSQAANMLQKALQTNVLTNIERDLVLAKLANAYDIIRAAQTASPAIATPASAHDSDPAKPAHNMDSAAGDVLLAAADDLLGEIELDIADEPRHVAQPEPQPKPLPEPQPEPQPEPEPQPVPEPEPYSTHATQQAIEPTPPETIADRFRVEHKSINEQMGQANVASTIASHLQSKPIADIGKAIGLGDKHVFIKELFGGSPELYASTINKLNRFDDLNSAIIYLQENFTWSSDNPAAMQLIELVRRKYL